MSDPIGGAGAARVASYTGAGDLPASVAQKPAGATVFDPTSMVGNRTASMGGGSSTEGLPPPRTMSDSEVQTRLAQNMAVGEAGVTADVFSMMALFQKMAQEMRSAAKEDRQAQMTSQVSQLQSAADEIRSAAQDRFVGAVVSGALQIGAGAVQMGAGMLATRELGKGMSAANKAEAALKPPTLGGTTAGTSVRPAPGSSIEMTTMPPAAPRTSTTSTTATVTSPPKPPTAEGIAQVRADAAKQFDANAASIQSKGAIYNQASGGIGTIVSAFQEKSAAGHDAKKAELEAGAKVAEAGVQAASDMAEKMMDIIRDVRDKISSMQQAQVETVRSIARNI